MKNDIKNEILEEVKDSITEEIHNHMNKLKDENKEVSTDQCNQHLYSEESQEMNRVMHGRRLTASCVIVIK